MPITNFDLSDNGEIIPAQAKCIRILFIWFELASDWVAGTVFGLQWDGEEGVMFRKTTKGLAAVNLIGPSLNKDGIVGGRKKALHGYFSASGKTVRGTIIWEKHGT